MDFSGSLINFPDSINGFSQSEYLTIFWSLLFAFVVAEYVISCGKLIKYYKRISFYWEFIAWLIVLLFDFIITWYFNWLRMVYINENLFSFILLLLPSLSYFIIIVVFFPDFSNKKIDLRAHFDEIARLFFFLYSVYLLINIVVDFVLPVEDYFYARFSFFVFLAITITLTIKPNLWLRKIILVIFYISVLLTIPFL
jgi:hypothetical protein